MSGVDTKVLMTSYVEYYTSQSKGWIFDFGSMVHVYFHKEMFNSLVAKEEGSVKMVDSSACGSSTLEQSMLHAERGCCVLWRRSGISKRYDTI